MAPQVSVILPTHDRRKMVAEAVDSVLAQSFRELEIVVVDDGSEDGTAAALEARYGSRVRVVTQARRGAAAARNLGLGRPRRACIAFLCSGGPVATKKPQNHK